MFYTKKVTLLIVGTLSIFTAGSAMAGKTIYPASMCVQWSAGQPVPVLGSSRIFNNTNRTMKVDCPILHQHFGGILQNDDMDHSSIGIIDTHTSQNAKCWSVSRDQVGAVFYEAGNGGTRYTTGFGNHEQNLNFNRTNHNKESWAYIGCTIPPIQRGQSSGITYYSGHE